MPSRTADAIIAKAELCYSLDLISERTLKHVIARAETDPGYNPVLDLPWDREVAHEQELRRKAARRPLWRRLASRARIG